MPHMCPHCPPYAVSHLPLHPLPIPILPVPENLTPELTYLWHLPHPTLRHIITKIPPHHPVQNCCWPLLPQLCQSLVGLIKPESLDKSR